MRQDSPVQLQLVLNLTRQVDGDNYICLDPEAEVVPLDTATAPAESRKLFEKYAVHPAPVTSQRAFRETNCGFVQLELPSLFPPCATGLLSLTCLPARFLRLFF